MGLLALNRLMSMRRHGRQTQPRPAGASSSTSVAKRKRSPRQQDGDPRADKRTRHRSPELLPIPKGSSSSDEVGSCKENDCFEESEAELQNFDSCKIEEEDYYVYDEDEGCYVYGDEEPDYEFDESDLNQQIDLNHQLDYKFDDLALPPGLEASVPWLQKAVTDDGPGNFKSMSEIEDEIDKKYKFFKQFDTVEDFSDHHYADKPLKKTGKEWTKRIQRDWKLLENDLPGQLFQRGITNMCLNAPPSERYKF